MIRCNNCMFTFKNDGELELLELEDEFLKVCPNCKTDAFLMDIEVIGE